jgi:hypothetical protein
MLVLGLSAGTASAASLVVLLDRTPTGPVAAGENFTVTLGISLETGEFLDGAQLGFNIDGAIPVGFSQPVYTYDRVLGDPPMTFSFTEDPWSLIQEIGAGPLTEVLGVYAMNVQQGDPMTAPYYGASIEAQMAGVDTPFAPLGSVDVVTNGLDGVLVIPGDVNPADVFALPGEVKPDFGPGTSILLWEGKIVPEPGAAVLLGLGLAALGFTRVRSA